MILQQSKMLSFHDVGDKDTGFTVALWVEHYLRSSVPSCGNVLREEAGVVVVWISDPRQAKVTYLSPIQLQLVFHGKSISQEIYQSVCPSVHTSINQSKHSYTPLHVTTKIRGTKIKLTVYIQYLVCAVLEFSAMFEQYHREDY